MMRVGRRPGRLEELSSSSVYEHAAVTSAALTPSGYTALLVAQPLDKGTAWKALR
jgi:hypothetical protein